MQRNFILCRLMERNTNKNIFYRMYKMQVLKNLKKELRFFHQNISLKQTEPEFFLEKKKMKNLVTNRKI